MSAKQLVIFGEVLFDHFPDGKQVLGGAPFNVAWHLQAFGQAPLLVSRVGMDPQGQSARKAMNDWGMELRALQLDSELPTGRVDVHFQNSEPHYGILHPAAFDAISSSDFDCRLETPVDLLYHGTLALRDAVSGGCLEVLRRLSPRLVFVDVNLRDPWWHRRQVLELVAAADWVKLNANELEQLGCPANFHVDTPARFLDENGLEGLVITDGGKGARILTAEGASVSVVPERGSRIVDTVGAGDALTAVILLGLLEQWPLETALQRAQAFASAICGKRGATVQEQDFYHQFLLGWKGN